MPTIRMLRLLRPSLVLASLLTLATSAAAGGDYDADGVSDQFDNCPVVSNPDQSDADDDAIGDVCDNLDNRDLDSDGEANKFDNCPIASNPGQEDADADGVGDECDDVDNGDLDVDGVSNDVDNCPLVSNPDQANVDSDDVGDACDSSDGSKENICDINLSGTVTVSDALTALRASVGIPDAVDICCPSGECDE